MSLIYLVAVAKGAKQHVVELVKQIDLEASKQKLDVVTALHVYSLQPALPKSTAELWNSEREQSLKLFEDMVGSKERLQTPSAFSL